MQRLRTLAFQTISRAICFVALAIGCMMFALAFDPLMSLRAGGILVFILLATLLYKAQTALNVEYRHTELWLYLEKHERPAETYAKRAVPAVLREAYLWFARWTAAAAGVIWAASLILSAAGVDTSVAMNVAEGR